MNENDLELVRAIDKKIWKEHPPRGFEYGWQEDLPVSKEDLDFVIKFLKKNRNVLIFEPGGGVFGFGVSMTVYAVTPPLYPLVPYEFKQVISLTSKQLFPDTRAGTRKYAYEWIDSFTLTEQNAELRKEVGRRGVLKPAAEYDY